MKLYSHAQLIKTTLICVVAAVLLTAAIFVNISKKKTSSDVQDVNALADEAATENAAGGAASAASSVSTIDESAAFLEQNPASIISVAGSTSSGYTQEEAQNINVYALCNEAVVNINTQVTAYDWFLQPYVQDGGSGSGSIIDKRGYILTNVHVIADATKIYVSLFDGTQYEVEVVGTDLDSDLAVIKFTPPAGMELKTIAFGDSSALKVGQRVIAIGNPFGLERTMTTGIVSGLGRPIQNSNNRIIRDMVQTDAAINPGNSGGPLLDTNGKMIGINTMIQSSSGSSAGVGFAVPSTTAVRVVADLIKYGKVHRGTIDATVIQMSRRIAQYAGLDIASGVLISEVVRGGNAEAAGLKGGTEAAYYGSRRDIIYIGGDVITQIDNIAVTSLADYYSALESKKAGDVVTVVVRRNRKNVTLKIKLVES
ncbi:S1C family serine protease [Treponema bryantii]|uniref:S1C family serine protease n=1 Tax=Treponema bryantii TaxID=163 RepID=UPI0003B5051D|nr:trypsin-like peptidase domain-containing protein [Treponema bryantii]